MKLSEKYNIQKTQFELDCIDIDFDKDTPLFLDPFLISQRLDQRSRAVSKLINNYFQFVVKLIRSGDTYRAREVLSHLSEPNETCLGLSSGKPQGRGMGQENQIQILESLTQSEAVKFGLVEKIEDTEIFIKGIGPDKVSDMTTQIIRKELIKYTQDQCRLLNIPLESNVASGYYWDPIRAKWVQEFTEMLIVEGKRILLVPKYLVSYYKVYLNSQYHQHYVLEYLQADHLERNTSMVTEKRLKDGSVSRSVYKKTLKENIAPLDKDFLVDFTIKHPEIFRKFREGQSEKVGSLSNVALSEHLSEGEVIEILKEKLKGIKPGNKQASEYHDLIIGILEFLFYPELVDPIKEKEINQGRKRIDITFDNAAKEGFFYDLHKVKEITSLFIMFECKNYSNDPTNPELDQLSGRFDMNRGKFGVLCCRELVDEEAFQDRCRDYWKSKRELILPLTDEIVTEALRQRELGNSGYLNNYFKEYQRQVIDS